MTRIGVGRHVCGRSPERSATMTGILLTAGVREYGRLVIVADSGYHWRRLPTGGTDGNTAGKPDLEMSGPIEYDGQPYRVQGVNESEQSSASAAASSWSRCRGSQEHYDTVTFIVSDGDAVAATGTESIPRSTSKTTSERHHSRDLGCRDDFISRDLVYYSPNARTVSKEPSAIAAAIAAVSASRSIS